ncbi:MAG: hypothetical protein OXN89_04785 [Bryobacterales bacterium]|nr:hypothetical protein [Bryobacterales bacterium]
MTWTREVRNTIYEETKHMTREERQEWYSRRPRDPVLARLFDRRKRPVGGKPGRGRRNPGGPPSVRPEVDAPDFDTSDQ